MTEAADREIPESPPGPRGRWRHWLARLLPLVIGGGLLALILSRIDLARLGGVLKDIQGEWYALALLLLLVNLLLISGRWRFNLRLLHLHYPYLELFLIDQAGALAGAATPGRMGDLARLVYFRQEKPVLVRIGVSILVERFLDLTVLVALALVFLWVLPLPRAGQRFWSGLALAAALLGLALLWTGRRFWGKDRFGSNLLTFLPAALQQRLAASGAEVLATLQGYATWRLLWSVGLTLLAWGVNILSAYCSTLALHLPLTVWQTGACFCLSTLFTLIPVSIAGIGTRELALVYLFSLLGLPAEQALAFSFLILGFLVVHSLIGFLALLSKPPQPCLSAATGR
ncbi:MAG: lysylphosphatidylglycerol synthase transmembrane domain-containing protein [Desulfobacca sp.]|uniref:lysylphosphatidylglycerol synthase transmembrane domain-containing protein n=1 Tax=Desulfobacca sp. TaxID=2067990 RepID=UPI00404977D7